MTPRSSARVDSTDGEGAAPACGNARARDVTALAHEWIGAVLAPGAVAIDATTGCGGDTEFLARAVGSDGRVHAFDIQPDAISHARARLARNDLADRVRWHRMCHSRALDRLPEIEFDAIMFNLGWLPGSDRAVVTRPETTVAALDALAPRLRPGGRLSVIVYRGHTGGPEEDRAVAEWTRTAGRDTRPLLDLDAFTPPRAPVLRVFERCY